jgi:hypothetical protein
MFVLHPSMALRNAETSRSRTCIAALPELGNLPLRERFKGTQEVVVAPPPAVVYQGYPRYYGPPPPDRHYCKHRKHWHHDHHDER